MVRPKSEKGVRTALAVDRTLNGRPASRESGLWIEDRGVRVPDRIVMRTPRIGVDYAGPIWAAKPWRFVVNPAAIKDLTANSEPWRSGGREGRES